MSEKKNTIYGLFAILFWSTAAAFTRTLSEDLGTFTAATCVYCIAGALAVIAQIRHQGGVSQFRSVPLRYWLICGSLFTLYVVCAYLSVSIAQTREQVMVVILIKFQWPLFSLLLTIPILKKRASPWLIVGVVLSIFGIAIANIGSKVTDFSSFVAGISGSALPYIIGFVAAIAWAFYSNFSRKLVGDSEGGASFFILITGLILAVVRLFIHEDTHWSIGTAGQLFYQAIFTSFLATLLWDAAMRKGKMVVVLIASNFLPLIATFVSMLLLGVTPTPYVWLGAAMIVAGTFWSKRCFEVPAQRELVLSEQTP